MGEVRTSSMEVRFKKLREAPEAPKHSSKPKIQKVPFMLRNPKTFEKFYEPRAVAIGPFHHGNPRCELAEDFKLMLTKRFLDYTEQKAEDVHHKIEKRIKELKDCYTEEATQRYDDEALAWMLFLDGCSTLQFIQSFVDEELEELSIKRDQIAFAQQDLFLLENQVPYQVLELLMSSSNKRGELKNSIETYVQANIGAPGKKHSKEPEQKQPNVAITMEKEPAHLLDLLRTKMLGTEKNSDNRYKDHSVQSFLTHRLDLLRIRMLVHQKIPISKLQKTPCNLFAMYKSLMQPGSILGLVTVALWGTYILGLVTVALWGTYFQTVFEN
ncbi:UPF0481 protein At3g47200-like [Pyrus x bretschneideri]|uniref:UPF0481 protein At3g47200-like n=1 Tax=Pyrus x bretschneideri TaxID=225117 RepID=UPI00202DFB05|nr:UPF0481 protein At3g47200-like [Pyrus x bretschneideri]